jgi:hypothetical protein
LLSLLGTLWSNKFLPLALLYGLLKRLNLVYPLIFLVLVVPSLLGTYAYLGSQGLHPLISVFATIGIQFGGQFIEVWNAFWSIQGASLGEGAVIFLGASAALLRLLWYFYIWNWFSDNAAPTVNNFYKHGIAVVMLLMSIVIALLVDVYALPETGSLSGYTYVLSNPEIVLEPFSQFLGEASAEGVEALNTSLNNSSLGG